MNTNLTKPITTLLQQIEILLVNLSNENYITPLPLLSGATLGQHTRHILEFYLELANGYNSGKVNYDARKRDHRIESNRQFAADRLTYIIEYLDRTDKPLQITADYGDHNSLVFAINTNYYRELMYNLEHTVHHMAFIRIGVNSLVHVDLDSDFGVAVSTIKYREACAQ